jgi:hypothetical protein
MCDTTKLYTYVCHGFFVEYAVRSEYGDHCSHVSKFWQLRWIERSGLEYPYWWGAH